MDLWGVMPFSLRVNLAAMVAVWVDFFDVGSDPQTHS